MATSARAARAWPPFTGGGVESRLEDEDPPPVKIRGSSTAGARAVLNSTAGAGAPIMAAVVGMGTAAGRAKVVARETAAPAAAWAEAGAGADKCRHGRESSYRLFIGQKINHNIQLRTSYTTTIRGRLLRYYLHAYMVLWPCAVRFTRAPGSLMLDELLSLKRIPIKGASALDWLEYSVPINTDQPLWARVQL
jgi:hypothetical protein